jgi:hypothetical protein
LILIVHLTALAGLDGKQSMSPWNKMYCGRPPKLGYSGLHIGTESLMEKAGPSPRAGRFKGICLFAPAATDPLAS